VREVTAAPASLARRRCGTGIGAPSSAHASHASPIV